MLLSLLYMYDALFSSLPGTSTWEGWGQTAMRRWECSSRPLATSSQSLRPFLPSITRFLSLSFSLLSLTLFLSLSLSLSPSPSITPSPSLTPSPHSLPLLSLTFSLSSLSPSLPPSLDPSLSHPLPLTSLTVSLSHRMLSRLIYDNTDAFYRMSMLYYHMGEAEDALRYMYCNIHDCKCACTCTCIESHPRQLIFLRKSDCLGCAMLLCLVVCLTLLASFFLPSFSSLIKTCIYMSLYNNSTEFLYCSFIEKCVVFPYREIRECLKLDPDHKVCFPFYKVRHAVLMHSTLHSMYMYIYVYVYTVHVQEYLRACSTLYSRLYFVQKVKKLDKQLKSASAMIQNQKWVFPPLTLPTCTSFSSLIHFLPPLTLPTCTSFSSLIHFLPPLTLPTCTSFSSLIPFLPPLTLPLVPHSPHSFPSSLLLPYLMYLILLTHSLPPSSYYLHVHVPHSPHSFTSSLQLRGSSV